MNIKKLAIGVGVVVLIPVVVLGWWLLSPILFDTSVDEAFPLSAEAVVPADMTQEEVEQVMSTMAKVGQTVAEAMPSEGTDSPVALKTGAFQDADNFHKGSGNATIYRAADDSLLLRLEDFRVTNGPDLHVILTPHPDPQSREDVSAAGYVDLGSLKGNVGNQNYVIPADAEAESFSSVVIYCQPFHVIFSVATLQTAG